jgi:hypothetical protein
MEVCGERITTNHIRKIDSVLHANPTLSRQALSRRICEDFGWRAPNGRLQEVSCRKLLVYLHRQKKIQLPDTQAAPRSGVGKKPGPVLETLDLECNLKDLGEIIVVPVKSRYSKASRIWNAVMDRDHYLGKGPLCGAQIRYLIHSTRHGLVGAAAFSAAHRALKKRDLDIGWTPPARRANLHRVVCNSRFLIVAGVRVKNLASCAMSRCLARLADDWTNRYGYAPVLVESFVDPLRHLGTLYRASNWRLVGTTAGRTTGFCNGKVASSPKDIYLYALRPDWRGQLCKEPPTYLRPESVEHDPELSWAHKEFSSVRIADPRLRTRLKQLAEDFFAQPGDLIPRVCEGSKAKAKAAYRFFNNPNVTMEDLLRAHTESSIERLREQKVVLAVQDTTTLNYSMHPPDGCGPIGAITSATVGLILHNTLAFSPVGTPLGLLNVQCWGRPPHQEPVKKNACDRLPIQAKESHKWLVAYRATAQVQKHCPQTMLVCMGDREADLYDLFHEANQTPEGPKLLIRAEMTRYRMCGQKSLWDKMQCEPLAGMVNLNVPRRGTRAARTASLQVRFAQVLLHAPKTSKYPSMNVHAVYIREDPQGQVEPLEWMLLTTVETTTFAQACERVEWYARRWGIEVFHRTLKSGCRIEDRRLSHTGSLESCLAIDMVVAWRIFWLTMAGRETPDASCESFLSKDEWMVLGTWATGKKITEPPTMRQVAHWVGRLGGWLSRSKTDNPGTTCLWRGMTGLASMTTGYCLAIEMNSTRAP